MSVDVRKVMKLDNVLHVIYGSLPLVYLLLLATGCEKIQVMINITSGN